MNQFNDREFSVSNFKNCKNSDFSMSNIYSNNNNFNNNRNFNGS